MPLLEWPTPTPTAITWLLAAILLVMFAVALWEIYRRRTERAARIRAEWRVVDEIARDKGLSSEQRDLLDSIVQRHSAEAPLRAFTVRQHFEDCVEREMTAIQGKADEGEFERVGQVLRDVRLHLGLDFIPFGQRINSTRELNSGQVIWMARAGGASSEWLRASVVEVDEAVFRVVPPDDSTAATRRAFAAGDTIQCRMWRDEDARYAFNATLARVETHPPGWVLRHATQVNRTQSRAHYRVQHDQSCTVGILEGPVDGDTARVKERRAITKMRGRITSLSAGGVAILTYQAVPRQVLLRISVDLPGYEVFETEARIISSSALSAGRWLIRASFVNIEEDKRDSIAHYVLDRQQPLTRIGHKVE
ncbi:MAG: PilZ domain-containing protein [Candidatus Hydrogenedentes bacterium]|nr:PilZ domain-containing protein [Candidatus Hydrogenedentota bacterium]